MINCFIKNRKTVATILLSIFYCQTILAAYQPWRDGERPVISYTPESLTSNFKEQINVDTADQATAINKISADPISVDRAVQFKKKESEKVVDGETGGPTQPEMTSFKSVNSDNMVDLFSGDFSYNIPLLDVGGYPINLFYRSGITMDQDASWVGLGWNINPGTITRNLRGIPDDFDGKNDVIQKTTSIEPNKTIGGDAGGDIEFFGLPLGKLLDVNLNVSSGIGAFYNNYRGWGIENNINASISAGKASMGNLTAGLSLNNNSQEGLNISPSLSVQLQTQLEQGNASLSGGVSIGGGFSYNSRSGLVGNLSTGVNLSLQQQKMVPEANKSGSSMDEDNFSSYGQQLDGQLYGSSLSFASPSYNPSVSIPLTNSQFTFTAKVGFEYWGAHPGGYLKGYVSKQYIEDADITRTYPAYGYLHYQDANDNPQALLDFNREKDIIYRDKPDVPNIAVPSYTYDLFCITGEGTGGMFRAYRGDIGFVHDPYVTTKDQTDAASVDLGFGNLFHGGIDINANHAVTTTGSWTDGNPLANIVQFKQSDSVYEATYLRNPGEKAVNSGSFYKNIGDDDVVVPQLYQPSNGPSITSTNFLQHWRDKTSTGVSTLLNSATDFKLNRDKRTQTISYLTAAESSRIGLDTVIYNYGLNKWGQAGCGTGAIKTETRVNSFRQPNHMSEIDVLNADGRRYVYGLPVYNLVQKEVTFAADSIANNKITGMVKYTANDTTKYNHHGKDNYVEKEITSAYAHSFLLTSILSPDYVDVTGNGISDDDLGDAIKFNYTKVAGLDSAFGWRTPYVTDSATYNEGLQSYVRDDKGNYVYGEKEMWYLNSVESKNMIAIFVLQKRSDLKSVDEMGVISGDTTKSQCLKEIDLYSKSDYIKNGAAAKPIKTVHFDYTNELCRGMDAAHPSVGKLTLKKVWFTYNGNQKGIKNPYLFFYNSFNPTYTNTAYDRWGNYKNPLQNPRSSTSNIITNAEYPYALQDSTLANSNAAAWTMDSVILPSAGSIKVGYESDDYAYVQNKRAMQVFNVVGLSNSAPESFYSGTPTATNVSNILFGPSYTLGASGDNLFVSIRVAGAVTSAKDAYQKYLDGFKKIYFKLKVQMPTDQWGSGYEYIPVYADLKLNSIADSSEYGVLSLSDHPDIIWVQLEGINIAGDGTGDYSPLAKAAIQFLRLNLPSKAYPGYEVGDKLDVAVAVKMLGALGSNIIHAFSSFDQTARDNGWAVRIDTSRTLARLNNPDYKKYGGGLRVKYVKIYDNWKNLTGTQNQSVYGQMYDYTTIKNINGIDTRISSGVASWEPMMGGEENPFRIPLEYIDKVAPLAPVTMGYTEMPLGETFFPAPSVGYSQVSVRSIHSTNIKSATGYEETKFYTSYDFPVITDNSMLTPDTKKRYVTTLSDFLRINSYHYLSMSQGFKIELNDMNGKMKSQASYAETDSIHPIASSTYYYHVDDQNAEFKHLNNTVKVVDQQGVIDTTATIGKDVELMMDMREQRSITEGADYGANVDIFVVFLFPIPVPSYIPLPQREETRFQSAAATKVINRFGILDSVVAIDKGSKISTDNLLYDSETGDVLLTRTRNEFNDTLYNFTYPAHWAYSGMGPAYQNIDAQYNNVEILDGVLQSSSSYPGMIKNFESGDEIFVSGKFELSEDSFRNCNGIAGCPTPNFASNFDTTRIWAIDSKKIDSTSSLGIVFIDRYGNRFSASSADLKIIRSGHRNLTSALVGALTMLNSPIKVISGKPQLLIDSNKNVLTASAVNYTDYWKVETSNEPRYANYTLTLESGQCSGSWSYVDTNCNVRNSSLDRSDNCSGDFSFTIKAFIGSVSVSAGMSFVIDSNLVNPYNYGILGDWRSPKSFVYYSSRKESTATNVTDIRKNGVIQNFLPYWYFGNNYLTTTSDTSTYVWNSESTLFNRKGFEIENKDALGRYNSGLYGYNESLPVDVVQNSQYKDQFFDGLEDYGYSTQNCSENCTIPRTIDFTSDHGTVDNSMAHSGKYSLKVNGLDSSSQIFLISNNAFPGTQKLKVAIDSLGFTDTIVSPEGNGSLAAYGYQRPDTIDTYIGYIQADVSGYYVITSIISHTNFPWGTFSGAQGYELGLYSDGYTYNDVNDNATNNVSVTTFLKAGQKIQIKIACHTGSYFTGSPSLWWQRLGSCGTINSLIPTENIYDTLQSDSSVTYRRTVCVTSMSIRADSSSFVPSFKPTQGERMVFSAWVKQPTDCLCSSYDSNMVRFTFHIPGSPDSILHFKPTGNIIEGWQRYDTVLDIPTNADSMRLSLKSTGHSAVYFDDVRMLPYNANMKSFVYDPISLRLMAELDENNYATFYEYDDDGTLIRVKKETERGIETIKETRSSLSKINDQ